MARLSELYETKLRDIESAETLCEIARPLVQAKARRLIRRPGFVPADQEDIEQEAFARLLDRFRAEAKDDFPVLAFINRVINQSIANQIRDRLAQKRDSRLARSLNEPLGEARRGRELGDAVSQSELDARLQRLSRPALEMVELGMDVEEALAEFSQAEQELCRALQIDSISELGRRLDVPRSTLNDKVRKLRLAFEDRELQSYIE